MTQSDTQNVLYNEQCLSCTAQPHIREDIHTWYEELGKQWTEIARRLISKHEVAISPDAISNHLTKHLASETTIQPLLGVVKPPKGWEPKLELDGDAGEITSTPQRSDKISDFSDILEEMGLDSNEFTVDGSARISKWQTFSGEWLTSYKVRVVRKNPDAIELKTLFDEVRDKRQRPITDFQFAKGGLLERNPDRTLVVPFADLQIGKNGSRGGSVELIDRVQEKKEKLANYIRKANCGRAVIVDAGDIVENFENTAQQMHTNDLSLMAQLDLAGVLEEEFIELLVQNHDHVDAGAVPSNHASWRRGKDVLGKPSDDWGIFLLRQIQRSYEKYATEYKDKITFHYPDEWRKSMTIDVQGYGLGLVHGDDVNRPEAIPGWWANQVHGGGPLATADFLVSGHFHTFRFQPSGRNPVTGKQKWWIASPTLDNGSDWYANGSGGGDSDPGLLSFVIDKDLGLDFQSFTIL